MVAFKRFLVNSMAVILLFSRPNEFPVEALKGEEPPVFPNPHQ